MPRSIASIVHGGAILLAGITACTRPNPAFDSADTVADGSLGGTLGPSSGAPQIGDGGSADDTGRPTDRPPMDTTSGVDTSDADTTGPLDEPPTLLFINFGGAMIVPGTDDASLDQSEIAMLQGVALQPFGNGPKRVAIMEVLHDHWDPFYVEVTDQRPAQGDYSMVVVTPTNPTSSNAFGLSLLDCDDMNPRNVGFVFASIDDGTDAPSIATAISHAAAHGYGQERAMGNTIMNPSIARQPGFDDQCWPLIEPPMCRHSDACPVGSQNSFEELSERFAPP